MAAVKRARFPFSVPRSLGRGAIAAALAVALLITTSGCVVTYTPRDPRNPRSGDQEMTQRHLIIGFGIVEVRSDPPAAIVQRSRALGVQIAQQPDTKVVVGYADRSVLLVPKQADDVRLEAREHDGVFTVKVDSAQLSPRDTAK